MQESTSPFHHQSVLLAQTVTSVCRGDGSIYLDGTLGGGGHTQSILEVEPNSYVIGIDRDHHAIQASKRRLERFGNRFIPLHGCFGNMDTLLTQAKLPQHFQDRLCEIEDSSLNSISPLFDGILLDLGVSSPQLDHPDRGFSFSKDGPVDMRMDTQNGISARDFLLQQDEDSLANVLYYYGEEHRSRRISRAIIEGNPWESTVALAACIARSSGYKNSKTHPATRSFQAIRIAVNSELEQLQIGLQKAMNLIKEEGILSVISFHSLEDRIVKDHFRYWAGITTPKDIFGHPTIPPLGNLLHKKGLSGKEYDAQNPRSRSARLRCFQRNKQPFLSEHIFEINATPAKHSGGRKKKGHRNVKSNHNQKHKKKTYFT